MTRQEPPLLYGADAISDHLGIGVKQVYYLHDKGELPTFKVRSKVCARRADLDAWLERAAAGQVRDV